MDHCGSGTYGLNSDCGICTCPFCHHVRSPGPVYTISPTTAAEQPITKHARITGVFFRTMVFRSRVVPPINLSPKSSLGTKSGWLGLIEAKLLASLNHPNIATIHGLEEDNGPRFLVLELVEGDTLADQFKRLVPTDN